MTTSVAAAPTTVDPVEALDLAEDADRRWEELDAHRELPADLAGRALDVGLFRTLVPTELGGAGFAPVEWFRTGVELARRSPSLAWTVTQGAAELGWIAAGGDERWAAEVLADRRGASASSVAGLGQLSREGSTWSFQGRWGFNTGCTAATWIGGLAVVAGSTTPGGLPELRFGWVPAARAEIVRDWDATGMRGTGSHTTVVAAQAIEPEWTFSPFEPTANDRGPYRFLVGNGNWPIAGSVAAVQLGAARRALDEAERIVLEKAPPPELVLLRDTAVAQRAFVRAESMWRACVASVERELEAMWDEATRCDAMSTERRVALLGANAIASEQAVRIVEAMCRLAGTTAVGRHHPLDRIRRDVQVLSAHLAVNGQALEHAGKVRLGVLDHHLRV